MFTHRSQHRGVTVVNTKLNSSLVNASVTAHNLERRLKYSKRTAAHSNKPVTLAHQQQPEKKLDKMRDPLSMMYAGCSRAKLLAILFEMAELQTYQRLAPGGGLTRCLLRHCLIHEDPRDPESGRYCISRAGMDYVEWLMSKKG